MNQTPEQIARDEIDQQLEICGWKVQSKKQINLAAGLGVAVREYQTDIGPADYVLFVDKKPVGVIEAKWEDEDFQEVSKSKKLSKNRKPPKQMPKDGRNHYHQFATSRSIKAKHIENGV